MSEAKVGGEQPATPVADHPTEAKDLDPGAYIGREPELEAETIPGGVQPGDERVAAYGAAPGVAGEPEATQADAESDLPREAGKDR